MKYLILSLVLFVGCSNVYLQDTVEVSTVPVMCKVPDLNEMTYSVTLWTVDSLPRQIESVNLNFMEFEYFITQVPTTAVDITLTAYEGESTDYSYYSESIIRKAVPWYVGEYDKKDTTRGGSEVYGYVIGGDLVYTLNKLKPRDRSERMAWKISQIKTPPSIQTGGSL